MTGGPTSPPGVILAGGRSSRMGTDKAQLSLGGDTILGHVLRRLTPQVRSVALNASADFPNPLGLRLVPDTLPGQLGPLTGILAAMQSQKDAAASHVLTVPCDSPFLPLDLAARLQREVTGAEVIAVAASDNRTHPVFALWPVALADDLEAWLRNPDNRRINAFLRRHRVETVEFPLLQTQSGSLDPFLNINTPDDLAEAQTFIGALQ